MIEVGIREFKAKISLFLRAVRDGELVVITDRGKPVAQVRAPDAGALPADEEARYWRLVALGVAIPPEESAPLDTEFFRGMGFPRGTAQRLIDDVRGDR